MILQTKQHQKGRPIFHNFLCVSCTKRLNSHSKFQNFPPIANISWEEVAHLFPPWWYTVYHFFILSIQLVQFHLVCNIEILKCIQPLIDVCHCLINFVKYPNILCEQLWLMAQVIFKI